MGETSKYLREHPLGNTEYLVNKAKSGSQTAWEALYKQYRLMLVTHVQARIPGFARPHFDAEDVLQVAFLRAYENIHTFQYQGEGSFRRWLATLVVNAFQNELRKRGNQPAADGDGKDVNEPCTPESEVALSHERVAMLEALGLLDDEDRDILIQYHFEDLSFEEIARNQGCGREKARDLYDLALKRLQRRLGA